MEIITRIVITSILLAVYFYVRYYVKNKYISLEMDILKHIKKNHYKDYKELSIPLSKTDDSNTVLGNRILRKGERLPKDPFLEVKYLRYIKMHTYLILVSSINIIFLIFLWSSLLI